MGAVSQASKTLGEFCPDSTGRQLLPWEILYCRSKLAQSLSTYNFGGTRFITLQCHLGAHMAALHESHPLYVSSNGKLPYQGWANRPIRQPVSRSQCYQIAREAGTSQEDNPSLSPPRA
ncbi:hypothetical protein CK203_006648 [Vitis vinifera]|uniref:Uncharacterized protein n=1 Tax=Vitis vinifera TaxID=29760 RepID=A0A438KAS0_VITVI|nr:hypothetical protein CK203_006648 [Vitis vinifera]